MPYPIVDGHTIVPVDRRGFPATSPRSPSFRAPQLSPSRPVSILTRDGLRLQSMSAYDMFRDVNTTPFRAENGLIEAVNRYNREFMAESDALDYETSGTSTVHEALLVPSSGLYFIFVFCHVVLPYFSS